MFLFQVQCFKSFGKLLLEFFTELSVQPYSLIGALRCAHSFWYFGIALECEGVALSHFQFPAKPSSPLNPPEFGKLPYVVLERSRIVPFQTGTVQYLVGSWPWDTDQWTSALMSSPELHSHRQPVLYNKWMQQYPAYLLWNRRKTLTGSLDPTRAYGTNRPCIIGGESSL